MKGKIEIQSVGTKLRELAVIYGVSMAQISRIRLRQSWSSV